MSGPLSGVRVLELAGLGPGPFAAMLLADMGADVIRVDRVAQRGAGSAGGIVGRGRRSIAVDLKHPDGRAVVLDLVAGSDVLVEAFRPGVTERLGLGPDDCLAVNPRLVYGRMTGWGQDGPLAPSAGHDIGYIAVTGALHASRRAGDRPVPPMNLLGDLGGGALYFAFGIVCALWQVERSDQGQVIDAAIVDGTASLTNLILDLRAMGDWSGPPGGNLLDSGAPFYEVYACADGAELAVGALEPKFYAELLRLTGAAAAELAPDVRMDPTTWPAAKERWAQLFATRSRAQWLSLLEGTDACVAPVLSWDEAPRHPHLAARGTFVERDGVVQAAPAPRFSRTPATLPRSAASYGQHTDEVLRQVGRSAEQIEQLRSSGAVT
ncbi:MAG: CaiB/BaiF CoA-transferase family protein [Actinomycetota bacterium]